MTSLHIFRRSCARIRSVSAATLTRIVSVLALSMGFGTCASATSITHAAGFTGFPSTSETRNCPQVLIPNLYPNPKNPIHYGVLEIDVFGRPAPTCKAADRQLNLVPTKLARGKWGRVGSWRCFWALYVAECKRGQVQIDAVNPGD
jgi:hypothetical protein